MTTSINEFPHMMGDDDGPLASDHYKRAVLRAAPSRFAIEFLPPTKVGGSTSYSYGMRVSPITRGDRSSLSSNDSNSEYDVWRRWEDCLWFQDGLELEYKRSARQKRQRLVRGKGIKKDGFYKQDQASSWESLPPGPDPNTVAQDIHDYVPKLTKRGTLFRTSPATIEQRNTELQAFVKALFTESQPSLLKEMRSTRLVTDFFGYWQRDSELAAKNSKAKARDTRESRESLTPSIFSSYFSASSTPSLVDTPTAKSPESLPTSPIKRPLHRPRASTSTERPHSVATSRVPASMSSLGSRGSDTYVASSASSAATARRRALSVASSDSGSSHSDISSEIGTVSSDPKVVEEVPVMFGHNPLQHMHNAPRPASMLDVLPEEHDDMATPLKQQEFPVPPRNRVNGLQQRRNRNGQIFVTPPDTPATPSPFSVPRSPSESTAVPDRSIRESWATVDSTSTYLEGLNIGLPASHRYSTASVNTFMTTDSAEAIHPRIVLSPVGAPESQEAPARRNPRASVPVSLSDFDMMYPEFSDDDDINSIYDAFPRPASFIPDRPETPVAQSMMPRSKTPEPFLAVPPSPTTSVSTTFSSSTAMSASTSTSTVATSSSSGNDNTLSIKAALNNTIIMLRVSRDITFTELRQRIYNKFIGQEGVPLSKEFTIAVTVSQMDVPIAQLPKLAGRKRSASVTSVDNPEMRIVDSQGDWEVVAYTTEGTKLTLRILDTPA